MSKIGFIGAGNMAQALIKAVMDAKLFKNTDIYVSDIITEKLDQLTAQFAVNALGDNIRLIQSCDIIFLSVKPQNMKELFESIKSQDFASKTVISIAAGIKCDFIAENLKNARIIRVMPNTPALVNEAASAIYPHKADKAASQTALDIFSAVGKAIIVENEEQIDAVTAVSGSGPAYFFLLMEAMISSAKKLGLTQQNAQQLVLQTAKGAAVLAQNSHQNPDQLRKNVTSPGGTTEAAINIFTEHNFNHIVELALTAARDRSIELSSAEKS